MTGNKKVLCKVCYKEMRSDILTRHMKVHETNVGSKRTYIKKYQKINFFTSGHDIYQWKPESLCFKNL